MLSMTGFGTASQEDATGTAIVEVASVNNRGLAVQVRGDLRDLAAEETVRRAVKDRVARGSVTVRISWQPAQTAILDRERIATVWRDLAAVADAIGAPRPTLVEAMSMAGPSRIQATDSSHAAVFAALSLALDAFVAARSREGSALAEVMGGHAAALHCLCGAMVSAAVARLPRVREQLRNRLAEALGEAVPIAEEVLARELAIHADRLDVREELDRLAAHLVELDRLFTDGKEIGRRLEFLLQEIGREINTTGAKSNDVELTRLVLEAKNRIEQIREQAANLE